MGNESPTEGRTKRIGRAERPTEGRERSPPVIPLSRSPTAREGATEGSGQRAWGRGAPHAKERAGGEPRPTPAQDGHGAEPRRHEETSTHVQAAARQQTRPDEPTSRSGSDDTDPRRGAQGDPSATEGSRGDARATQIARPKGGQTASNRCLYARGRAPVCAGLFKWLTWCMLRCYGLEIRLPFYCTAVFSLEYLTLSVLN